MAFIWHEPRRRACPSEPRITISKQFISLNKVCVDEFIKDKINVKVGYDKESKKLIFVPLGKDDGSGMKIIINEHSSSRYINAGKLFKNFSIGQENKGEYRCAWDEQNQGVIVDLKNDKVK